MDMKTIYLSPHLDDVVFSCGGWIWEQTQQGHDVEIWTICAGDPPAESLSEFAAMLHRSWNLGDDAVEIRRQEDQEACQVIGAVPRHLSFLDCIYRSSPEGEPFYQTGEDIFGGLDPREADLIAEVSAALEELLPRTGNLIVPLGIGNHIDHDLTRKAASRLERELLYYADYPYARDLEGQESLKIMHSSREWQGMELTLSKVGLERWWQAAQAYRSQIRTFWEDEADLEREITDFSSFLGGMKLWEALEEND